LGVTDGPLTNDFSNEPFPTGTYNNTPDAVNDWSPAASDLHVFPNPAANGTIRVQSSHSIESITIHSMNGNLVHQASASGAIVFFDANILAPGIYTIEVLHRTGSRQVARFIHAEH